jgi:hypothetical protein
MMSFIIVLFDKYKHKKDEVDKAYSTHGKKRNAYRISVEKPKIKKSIGRLKRRWEDNTKINFR